MRVLFFIHSLSAGGAERVTATLANHWAAKGWEVTVVTVVHHNRDFYQLDERIKRIALDLDADSASIWAALRNNWRRVRALRAVLSREKPDVAVAMMSTANIVLALAALGRSIPVVGSERIHPPTLPLGRAWEVARRLFYRRLSAVVAQTELSAQWLRQNAPAPRVLVIPNPVHYPIAEHEPRVNPRAVIDVSGGRHILLAVGRLEHQKGFDRLIDAFAAVSAEHSEWLLVLLGEGSLRSEFEQRAAAHDLNNRVILPGAVGNVGEWLEAADLYVLSSRFEGFPNTLLEAMACGLPAVAVDCDTGPRDILRHRIDGLLVPQNDQAALCDALFELMRSADLRKQYGARGRDVRERFGIERVAKQWQTLFTELVSEST